MAYKIGYVVLGISFVHSPYDGTPDKWKAYRDELYEHLHGKPSPTDEYVFGNPTPGFESRYSGGDNAPEYFGIELGQFDECSDITGSQMIALCTASQEKMVEYAELVEAMKSDEDISEGLRAAISEAKADVIILFGTS